MKKWKALFKLSPIDFFKVLIGILLLNLYTKDVSVQGNDKTGYRFIITVKRTWKWHNHILRRGVARVTMLCDVTKEELIQVFASNDTLYTEIAIGQSDDAIQQSVIIPCRFYHKLVKQLSAIK